jgi:hypothetical protein
MSEIFSLLEVIESLSDNNKNARLEFATKETVIGILKNHLSSSVNSPIFMSRISFDSLLSPRFLKKSPHF